jgi:V8-like Glu-specific endopeptidase
MTDTPETRPDPIHDRLQKLRMRLARGSMAPEMAATESISELGGLEVAQPLETEELKSRVERTRDELSRIVRDYLGDDRQLHQLANDIAQRGERALTMLREDDVDGFERYPDAIGDLEAIVKTDGSRPTFLIREGEVDTKSSPLGTWGDTLDGDNTLKDAITCIGRLNDPSSSPGYQGTGILIQENLVMTNRHVLQKIARKSGDEWFLKPGTNIDFGHEFRGIESLDRRPLKKVVFVGSRAIVDPIDHSKLDVALIELEPATSETRPLHIMSIDISKDWNASIPAIFTIGYPFQPPRGVYSPTLLEQLFQQLYGYKRLAPGEPVRPSTSISEWTVTHDATTLGGNSGSVIVVAGRSKIAAGLHYAGRSGSPAENYGHVLSKTLEYVGEGGEALGDVFRHYEVVLSDRKVS